VEEEMAKTGSWSGWKVFGVMAVILTLCYWPAIATPYGFYDDYQVLQDVLTGHGKISWDSRLAGGRPVHALVTQISFGLISRPADLRYLRLLDVGFIITLAFIIYRTFVRAGWQPYQAVCMSLIIATLPPFQVFAAWALTGSYPLAALTAAAAFYLLDRVYSTSSRQARRFYIAASLVLMVLSVTNIQPAAMFFWCLAAILLFAPGCDLHSISRRVLMYGAVTFMSLFVGFGIYELGKARYSYLLPPARTHLAANLAQKADWFIGSPLRDSLNLINLSSNTTAAIVVAVFILIGMTCYFRGSPLEVGAKLLIALLIVPFSYLPNLVTADNWSSYRTQIALVSIIAIYTFLALQGYSRRLLGGSQRIISGILTLFLCVSLSVAAYDVDRYFAIPQLTEFGLIRRQLAQGDLPHAREIYIIACSWQDSIAPLVRYDEFGMPSCTPAWRLAPAVYFAVREMDAAQATLPITAAPPDASSARRPNAVLVDMRKLAALRP
jgi:hypothetical protein